MLHFVPIPYASWLSTNSSPALYEERTIGPDTVLEVELVLGDPLPGDDVGTDLLGVRRGLVHLGGVLADA